MQLRQLSVTKRAGAWGLVYVIGGTEADGELLPAEQADDLIARFEHEQALFGREVSWTIDAASAANGPAHINMLAHVAKSVAPIV